MLAMKIFLCPNLREVTKMPVLQNANILLTQSSEKQYISVKDVTDKI
jgi:hypothetical protein